MWGPQGEEFCPPSTALGPEPPAPGQSRLTSLPWEPLATATRGLFLPDLRHVPPRPPRSGLTGLVPDLATLSTHLPAFAWATSPPAPPLSLARAPVCLRAQPEQVSSCDFLHAPSGAPTHWTPLPQSAGRSVGAAVGAASCLPSCLRAGSLKTEPQKRWARLRRWRGQQDGVQARGRGGAKRGVAVAGVWLPLSGFQSEAGGLAFYTPHAS